MQKKAYITIKHPIHLLKGGSLHAAHRMSYKTQILTVSDEITSLVDSCGSTLQSKARSLNIAKFSFQNNV